VEKIWIDSSTDGLVLYLPMCGKKVKDFSENEFKILENGEKLKTKLVKSDYFKNIPKENIDVEKYENDE
jgi:hypothetical protein